MSHDRAFLDNVVTQTLVAEGDGRWREYVGGYSDWLVQRAAAQPTRIPTARRSPRRARGRAPKVKLRFKEAQELKALPGEIEALEAEQHALTERMCAPDYHQQPADVRKADRQRAEAIEHLLARKFERWAALDAKAGP